MTYKEAMETIVTTKEKEAWIDREVTLNGRPARISGRRYTRISGRKYNHPYVSEITGPLSVQFSWAAVKRIILNNGGKFTA